MELGRKWFIGFSAIPRLGQKLGYAEVYISCGAFQSLKTAFHLIAPPGKLDGKGSAAELIMATGKCAASQFPSNHILTNHILWVPIASQIRLQKACFLQRDISEFDAKLFGMTPDEAAAIDPQQRKLQKPRIELLKMDCLILYLPSFSGFNCV